jgi:hypothetical protein
MVFHVHIPSINEVGYYALMRLEAVHSGVWNLESMHSNGVENMRMD